MPRRRNILPIFILLILLAAIPGILCAIIFRSQGIPSNSTTTMTPTTAPPSQCLNCTWPQDPSFVYTTYTNGIVTSQDKSLIGATYWDSSGLTFQIANSPGYPLNSVPTASNLGFIYYPFINLSGETYVFYYENLLLNSFSIIKYLSDGNIDTSYGSSGIVTFSSFETPTRGGHVNPTTGIVAVSTWVDPQRYAEIDVFNGVITTPYVSIATPPTATSFSTTKVETGFVAGYFNLLDGSFGCFMNNVTFFQGISFCNVESLEIDALGDVYVGGSYSTDNFDTINGFLVKIAGGTVVSWNATYPPPMGLTSVSTNFIVRGSCFNVIVTNGVNSIINSIDTTTGNTLSSGSFISSDFLQGAIPEIYTAETLAGIKKYSCN